MASKPKFGYDPEAVPYEEMSTGRYLPGDIAEASPPKVNLLVHNWFECYSFKDNEDGWRRAVRKLRKLAASSGHPEECRIDRSALWDAGCLGELARYYHICYASDLPPEENAPSN